MLRVILAFFPRQFSDRYSYEIWQTVRDSRRDLAAPGFARTAIFWIRIVGDLARSGLAERARSVSGKRRSHLARRALGVPLIAAAAANVAYDATSEHLSMGVLAMLLTVAGVLAGTILISRRPRNPV